MIDDSRSGSRRCVILAASPSSTQLAAKAAQLISADHAPAALIHEPQSPGEALRFLHRHGAKALLICVTNDDLPRSSKLISAVRDRLPALPVLALTAEHDPALERSVREAGAAFYFIVGTDAREIRNTLETLSISRPIAYDDPVPARARGRPPASLTTPSH